MPDTATSPSAPAAPWKGDATHVSVRAPRGSHWRAGRQFGAEPTVLAKADVTARHAEMILGDPLLVVAEVADPAAVPAAAVTVR